VNVVAFITSQTLFDLVFVFGLLAALVIGFVQGAFRRLLGTLALLVSFLLAANLREPVGGYLARNWRQFPQAYSEMLAFLIVFLALWLVLSLVIQTLYRRAFLTRSEAFDEIVGALLGVVEALLLLGVLGVILDSYFTGVGSAASGEFAPLRGLWRAWDLSQIAVVYRETLVPWGIGLLGWFIPDAVEALLRG
jgi:uncharacterized membrane protein required for colicin V production